MKRLITVIGLIAVIFVGYIFISKGFENDKFQIASYNTIETKSEALTKKLAAYDKRNKEDYQAQEGMLNVAKTSYQTEKEKYETILEELQDVLNQDPDSEDSEAIEQVIYSNQKVYDIGFVEGTLGLYADKEGVDLILGLVSTNANLSTGKFFLADLQFTITGEYMSVSNFISDIESDSELGWEINDFSMTSGSNNGYSGVSAKINVKGVPIEVESYLERASQNNNQGTGDNANQTGDPNSNTTNTTNTTTDGNSVSNGVVNNNTNSTNTTNTTNTTVSNNTVN